MVPTLTILTFLFFTGVRCQMVPYVVNGDMADIDNFPHSAHLTVYCVGDHDLKQTWGCGASILNQKLLLTAAHCLFPCRASSTISVTVGSSDKRRGLRSTATSFLVHPRYISTSDTIANDIGMVKLKRPLKFNKDVGRVAILKNPPYNERAFIAGWGQIDEIRQLTSNDLQFVNQYVMRAKACKDQYKVSKGVICATSRDASQYSSRGDSGSALIVRDYIQIGIVSYKTPKVSRSVVMYTDVGAFYDWIKKYSKYLYCL